MKDRRLSAENSSSLLNILEKFFQLPTLLDNYRTMKQYGVFLAMVHALILLRCTEGELRIKPDTLLIGPPHGNLERQDHVSGKTISRANFSCLEVAPDQPPQIPPIKKVVWMKDGQVIETSGIRKYRHYRKQKILEIRDLNEMDSGLYECAASVNSTEKGRAELWIVPKIVSASSTQILRLDMTSTVECLVTGGRRTVDWWRNGLLIASTDPVVNSTDPRYSIKSTGSLVITSVTNSDRALYTCIVKNKAGQASKSIRVRVRPASTESSSTDTTSESTFRSLSLSKSQNLSHCVEYGDISFGDSLPLVNQTSNVSSSSKPQFTTRPHDCVQTREGYSIVLSCTAQGHPDATVQWSKEGELMEVSSEDLSAGVRSHFVQYANGSLKINSVQLADASMYTCTASNAHGSVSTDVQLEVRGEMELCGVKGHNDEDRRKRIVKGFAVSGIDEWPWQVLIEYKEDWVSAFLPKLFCGGALIRPDWIVTAAHCLFAYGGQWRTVGSLIIKAGVHNRTDIQDSHQQLLKVKRFIIHPSYSLLSGSSFAEHDIALIQLAEPVRPSVHVGTVCLPPQSQEPPVGSVCTVTGWGRLQHGVNEYPELLHQGNVPLVSQDDCRRRESYGRQVTDNMLCAGWREGGTDACQNDSGGPLVCQVPGNEGRWALYGVVNYGQGCGAPDKYGVYARVTKYSSWIDSEITTN